MLTKRLYPLIYTEENLNDAWNKVKSNKGIAGADDMDIARFGKYIFPNLSRLQMELKERTYQVKPVKEIKVKKKDRGSRIIGILTIEDRVVQRALLNVIEDRFEGLFLDCSYAYRPGRSHIDAVNKVRELIRDGHTWIFDTDIEDFFGSIDHPILWKAIKKIIREKDILRLIYRWLKVGKQSEEITWFGMKKRGKGILQGSVISPVLANLYLHRFDSALIKKGFNLVRFSDNFIIACKHKEELLVAETKAIKYLKRLRLNINRKKTNRVDIRHKGFTFLGEYISPLKKKA